MPLDFEITRCNGDDDPDRCQGVSPSRGQCINKKVPGSDYCPAHGGNKAVEAAGKASLRGYQLARWKDNLRQFSDDPKIKSLTDDTAILRMLVENLLNKCKDANDLEIHSGRIADLITRIEKLVTSGQRLDERTGSQLDKNAALRLGQEIANAISKQVETLAEQLEMVFPDRKADINTILESQFIDPIAMNISQAIMRARGNIDDYARS